jgi:class III poly(R)-hydroxyalkanoic acid synthase PhaE subunit
VPGSGGPGGAKPNWQDAIDWWSRLAHGGREEANAAVDRFNAQARNWYGQMQQVAARFAGQEAKPADITAEWKRALGAMGENPFPEMFRAMRGQGAQGLDQWIEDASPWLDAWRREGNAWLGMPTFGLGREHQERWQKLAQAQLDYQQYESTYNALMMKAAQRAYEVFEGKLAEREEPGRQLTSARALFDLWIDAAEEAYAEIALSPQFREAYGARINAQMRLRGAVQCEMERMSATFGMPTQGDLDIAFRKIAELERSLRRLRDQMASGPAPSRTSSEPEPSPKPAAKNKPAARSGAKAARPQASTGKGKQR